MRYLVFCVALMTASCIGGLDLPEIPARKDLPVPSRVDRAYEDLLDDPIDAEFNGVLGMAVHGYGDLIHAESLYRRAYMLDLEEFRWQYYLAHVQFSLNQYDAAVVSYRRALRTDPDYIPAKLQLAAITYRMGNYFECEQLSESLLASEEAAATASFWLGRVLESRRDLRGAAERYAAACERFPEFGDAHYRLGMAYREIGDGDGAKEHFILADQHKFVTPPVADPLLAEALGEPHRSSELLATGYSQERQGQFGKALESYREALWTDPRSDAAHARLITLCTRSGDVPDAMRHYQEAKELNPEQPDAYAAYGRLLVEQKRYQEAESTLEHALRLNPYHPEALVSRGLLFERNGKNEPAEDLYRRAVDCRPGHRDAHLGLGRVLLQRRRYREAFQHFDAVVSREDERTPELYYELSSLYIMAGDRAKATSCVRTAYALAKKYGQAKLLDKIEAGRGF